MKWLGAHLALWALSKASLLCMRLTTLLMRAQVAIAESLGPK
jgi:hypothetical protein